MLYHRREHPVLFNLVGDMVPALISEPWIVRLRKEIGQIVNLESKSKPPENTFPRLFIQEADHSPDADRITVALSEIADIIAKICMRFIIRNCVRLNKCLLFIIRYIQVPDQRLCQKNMIFRAHFLLPSVFTSKRPGRLRLLMSGLLHERTVFNRNICTECH